MIRKDTNSNVSTKRTKISTSLELLSQTVMSNAELSKKTFEEQSKSIMALTDAVRSIIGVNLPTGNKNNIEQEKDNDISVADDDVIGNLMGVLNDDEINGEKY